MPPGKAPPKINKEKFTIVDENKKPVAMYVCIGVVLIAGIILILL
jgi:hypothetical protein